MYRMHRHPPQISSDMSPPQAPGHTSVQSDQSMQPGRPSKRRFWSKKKPEPVEPPKYPPLPYYKLFRYTSNSDKLMLLCSLVAAAAHGSLLPILVIVFGRTIDIFAGLFAAQENPDFVPPENITGELEDTVNAFLIVAFIAFVVGFIQLSASLVVANRMGNELRRRFFDSLIRQDCNFYDDSEAGSLTHIVINDINLIQAGIGDKLATAVQYISTFVIGIIVGFVYGWELTLLILGVAPVLLISGLAFGNASADAIGDGLGAYGEAGGIASEVLSLVRTVTAFGGQEEECRRYEKSIDKAYRSSVKAAINSGLGLGTAMFLILSTYGLAFWVGSVLVEKGRMSVGDVLLTFFVITLGASSLGTAGPAFKSFSSARAAAPRVFEIIERKSLIDPLDVDEGVIPSSPTSGHVSFENVDFNYPKRVTESGESALVLDHFNLDIPVASSEAFVGKSGCGKSTIARLIQRFYDPIDGSVRLDGVDIRELNVRWLRSQIGVVAQTPALFMMSIKDNIALGAALDFSKNEKTGKIVATRRRVTEEEIVAAAKLANAHDFITKLPEGYDTMLGERGAMLSGGQKQRVCIARALVRNPKILILDESTASLDTASERLVQDALEKAAEGRTTVTIAHRLSTIKNADKISCIQNGKVIERGTHSELIGKEGGFYKNLFEMQNIQRQKMELEKNYDMSLEDDGAAPPIGVQTSVSRTGVDSTSVHPEIATEEEKKRPIDKGVFRRTLKLNKNEFGFIALGIFGAALAGVIWPLAAISLTELIEILAMGGVQEEGIDSDAVRYWALSFVVLAVMALVGNGLQFSLMGISGEKLIRKVRALAFRTLLKQEIGYFDMEENSVGALTGRLSEDAGAMKGLTGDLLGVGISLLAALIAGLVISLVNCWRITLVVMAIIPGVALGGYFEMHASTGIDSGARGDIAKANAVAAESVDNISTVRSLGVEDYFVNKNTELIQMTRNSKLRRAIVTGTAFGFSELCMHLIWYATFKAGGNFVEDGHCDFKQMLLGSMAILFAALTFGNISVFAPDLGASRIGATHIFRLLDRQSKIDPTSEGGEAIAHVHGDVSVQRVRFEYPRRPDVPVLRGLSFQVAPGKTIAIVGRSGDGKSTIVSLLERFYTIREGHIVVDDHDVTTAKVKDLRSHIGLVSQEPELFNRSVFENIAYGKLHKDGTPITMNEVIEAAKEANAHDFISDLPQGYDTIVGQRGEALSGGQRQRVAIARSLIRKPAVLLLDEATSSLDNASEKAVQVALDRAAKDRTTIVVAHRLSTIRNADMIVVVRKGKIVESGTHEELLRRNGFYADLVEHQLTEV